jgi:hypothetical protein
MLDKIMLVEKVKEMTYSSVFYQTYNGNVTWLSITIVITASPAYSNHTTFAIARIICGKYRRVQ